MNGPNDTGTVEAEVAEVERTIPMDGMEHDDSSVIPEGYSLGSLLGRGGEGEVHVAMQRVFSRAVAIKTVRKGRLEPALLRRFRAEAVVTAILEHPNIIPIYDLRPGEGGQLQLVMKKVGGRTWRQLLNGEPLLPGHEPLGAEDHLDILLKVCDAVAFAHDKGLLHRDLKPENVMVGDHGEVLVMDWGCAAHVGPKAPHPLIPTLAELTSASGTPSYMAPEMARGEHARCGPWSDVYLLGGILYLMLTGVPPHRRENVQAAMASAASGVVEDPSLKAGRKIPSELSRICMDALAADPDKRTFSVEDFASAIRRYRSHREVYRLLADARAQLETARKGGVESDDSFRRSMSACEQAVHLWPELAVARRLFVEVALDSARHALDAGAFRIAKRQADAAAQAAEQLGDGKGRDACERIADAAQRRETAARNREATLKAMRRLAMAAGAVAGLALLVGLLLVWRGSARTAEALAAARENLGKFEAERATRVEREHLAGPALMSQARELAAQRKFTETLPLLDAAQGFDADDPAPLLLKAQHLIALGRRDEAAIELDRMLLLRHDDADAQQLRDLCRNPPNDADARIADVLVRQGNSAAAATLNLAVDARDKMLREQLARLMPQLQARSLARLPDGTYGLILSRQSRGGFEIQSLEWLQGMPISSLNLSGQDKIRDLGPISGLPLATLNLNGTSVRDLSPLQGLKLRSLSVSSLQLNDLSIMAGMRLESLDISWVAIGNLKPLANQPLKELRATNIDSLSDLTPLSACPLELFYADTGAKGGAISDISTLHGKPLREVGLSFQRNLTSIKALAGAPLQFLNINSTPISDLSPLTGAPLRRLCVFDTQVADLRPILKAPLESLEISPQRIQYGLKELRSIASLNSLNSMGKDDFYRFLDTQRSIAAVNPAYAWNGKASYADGRLTTLELRNLRNLAPLKGMPLESLAVLNGSELADLSPLRGMRLRQAQFYSCGVTDLTPLMGMPLESLDLTSCKVADLTPLKGMRSLKRLVLLQNPVTNLAPLSNLLLTEIILPSPTGIQVDDLRGMPSLQRIGVSENRVMAVQDFWRAYDSGNINRR